MAKRRNGEKKDDGKPSKRLRTRAQHRKQTNQEAVETNQTEANPTEVNDDNPEGGNDPAPGPSGQAADSAESAAPPRADSPEPSCSICLGDVDNKSFTNSCFHTFCYVCLLEWSKVKAVCPLCKQPFKSIIHNVRSLDDYDEYTIPQEEPAAQRFRYRTTLTNDRWDSRAQQERDLASLRRPTRSSAQIDWRRRRQVSTSAFRKRIYNLGMRVQEVTTPAGQPVRYREISPAWFRRYPASTHRLVPWLNRELNVLLNNNDSQVTFLLELILDLIKRFDIQSPEFSQHINPFLGRRTDHFIHEFYTFARSPSDILSFDRNAIYQEPTDANPIHTLPSSSSSSDSVDDDDVIILPSDDTSRRPSQPSGHFFLPSPSRSEPQNTRSGDPLSFSPVLRRVADFLHDHLPDRAWGSPTPGPSNFWSSSSFFTPAAPLSSIPTFDDLTSIYSGPSSASRAPATASSGQPVFRQRPESARSPASSHESDIEVVGEEKPWTERSPIAVLSSDTEPELRHLSVDKIDAPKRHKDEKEKKSKKKKKKRSRSRDRHSYSSRHYRDQRREERLRRYSSQQSGSSRHRDRPPLLHRDRSVSRSQEERSISSTSDPTRSKDASHSYKRSGAREFRSSDSESRDERSPSRSSRHRRSRSKDTSRSSRYSKERHRDKEHRADRSKSKSSYSSTHELTSHVRSVVCAPSKSTAETSSTSAPQEAAADLRQGESLDLRLQPLTPDDNVEAKSPQRDEAGSYRVQGQDIVSIRSRSRSPRIRKRHSRSRSKKKKKHKTRSRSPTPATERSGRFPEIRQRHRHKSKRHKRSKSKELDILLGRQSRSSSVEVIFRKKHKSKKHKKHKKSKDSSVVVVNLLSSDEDEGVNEKENDGAQGDRKRPETSSAVKQWKKNATGHKKSSAKKSTSGASNQATELATTSGVSNDRNKQTVDVLDVRNFAPGPSSDNPGANVPDLGAEISVNVDETLDLTTTTTAAAATQSPASVSSETSISSYHSDYSDPNSPKKTLTIGFPAAVSFSTTPVVDLVGGGGCGGSRENPVMIEQEATAATSSQFPKDVVISSDETDDDDKDIQEAGSVNRSRTNPPYNWKNEMLKEWISSKHDFLPADDPPPAQSISTRSDGENVVVDQNSQSSRQQSRGSSVIDVCTAESAPSKDETSQQPIDVEATSTHCSKTGQVEKKSKETLRSFMEQLHEVIAGTSSENSREDGGTKDESDVKEELKDFNPVIEDVKGGKDVKEETKETPEEDTTITKLADQMEVKSELKVASETTDTSDAGAVKTSASESNVKHELSTTESFGISDVRSMDCEEFREQVSMKEREDSLDQEFLEEEPVAPSCSEVLEQSAEVSKSTSRSWSVDKDGAGTSGKSEVNVSGEEDEANETTRNIEISGKEHDEDEVPIEKISSDPGSVPGNSEEGSATVTRNNSVLHESDDVTNQTANENDPSSPCGIAELNDEPNGQDKSDESSPNDSGRMNSGSSPSNTSKYESLGENVDSAECQQRPLFCDNQKALVDNSSDIVENGVSGEDNDGKKRDDLGKLNEQDDSMEIDMNSCLKAEVASSSETQKPVVPKDAQISCVVNSSENETTSEEDYHQGRNSILATETEYEMQHMLNENERAIEKDHSRGDYSMLVMETEDDVQTAKESDAQTESKSETETRNLDVNSVDDTYDQCNGKPSNELSDSNLDTSSDSVAESPRFRTEVGKSERNSGGDVAGAYEAMYSKLDKDDTDNNSLKNPTNFSEAEKQSDDLTMKCRETGVVESKQTEAVLNELSPADQLSKKIHDLENSAFPLPTSAMHGDVGQL